MARTQYSLAFLPARLLQKARPKPPSDATDPAAAAVSFALPSLASPLHSQHVAALLGPMQLIGYLACAVSFSAFFVASQRRFLMVGATGAVIWALHYHLLGERVAAALSALSGGRNTVALRVQAMPATARLALTALGCAIVLALGACTWSGPLNALPMFASCLTMTASFWFVGRRFRHTYLVSDGCWLAFGLLAGSAAGAFASATALGLNLWTMRRIADRDATAQSGAAA